MFKDNVQISKQELEQLVINIIEAAINYDDTQTQWVIGALQITPDQLEKLGYNGNDFEALRAMAND